jgi:hypothetical protein
MDVSTDSKSLEDSTAYLGGMDTDICQGWNRIGILMFPGIFLLALNFKG